MHPTSKRSFASAAAVLAATLLLVMFAVLPARADIIDDDPTIEVGMIATLPGGAQTTTATTNNPFVHVYQGGIDILYVLNNTGSAWTSLEIDATMGGTGTTARAVSSTDFHSGDWNSAAGIAAAFGNPGVSTTAAPGETVVFAYTGGSVASGQYLALRFNNWNSNSSYLITPNPGESTFRARARVAVAVGAGSCRHGGEAAPEDAVSAKPGFAGGWLNAVIHCREDGAVPAIAATCVPPGSRGTGGTVSSSSSGHRCVAEVPPISSLRPQMWATRKRRG